jgi:hypothetical protein
VRLEANARDLERAKVKSLEDRVRSKLIQSAAKDDGSGVLVDTVCSIKFNASWFIE